MFVFEVIFEFTQNDIIFGKIVEISLAISFFFSLSLLPVFLYT